MSKSWSASDIALLMEHRNSGLSHPEIAKKMRRTRKSVARKWERIMREYGKSSSPKHTKPEFPDLPDVNDVSVEEYLDHIDTVQAFRQKVDPVITSAKIRLPTNGKPVAFSPTSCWHLGGLYTFHEEFRKKMNDVLTIDRFYWGAHGDEIEMFPPNWANTVFNNLIPPSQQKRLVAKIINKLHENGKLLYSMWSNHPAFEERITGENPIEILYKDKIPYFSGKGIVKLYVDDELYVMSVAHLFKGHSQWNPNHSQRRQLDNIPQADFVIQGDKHTYSYQEIASKIEAFDAGLQANYITHLVQTGTAKSLNDPYTIRGWQRGAFIWPTFILSAKEHKIHRVYDLATLEWYLQRKDF